MEQQRKICEPKMTTRNCRTTNENGKMVNGKRISGDTKSFVHIHSSMPLSGIKREDDKPRYRSMVFDQRGASGEMGARTLALADGLIRSLARWLAGSFARAKTMSSALYLWKSIQRKVTLANLMFTLSLRIFFQPHLVFMGHVIRTSVAICVNRECYILRNHSIWLNSVSNARNSGGEHWRNDAAAIRIDEHMEILVDQNGGKRGEYKKENHRWTTAVWRLVWFRINKIWTM